MSKSSGSGVVAARDDLWLWVGMSVWLIAIVVRWPIALSISDEVSYVAQAKLVLAGHLTPPIDTPGVWHLGSHGWAAVCFPFVLPIVMAPFVALHPRLVFVTGVVSALGIAWVASRALRSWGRPTFWALVVLAHPTVVLIARTAMADLALSAFAVGAWWALRNDRRVAAVILLVLLIGSKAVGFPIAAALVAGEGVRSWRPVLSGDRRAIVQLSWAAVGLVLGLTVVVVLNLASLGKFWYSYDYWFLGAPPFAFKHFSTSGRQHLITLLFFVPPVLLLGAWPFWKRREFGPLLVIVGFTAMMSSYYFVDQGRIWVETLILSPRLILPVVAFLLIGYADVLAAIVARVPRLSFGQVPILVIAPAMVALAISLRHYGWQRRNAQARETAAAVAAEVGVHELGLTESAFKAGMLYAGHTSSFGLGGQPKVVLCNKRSSSYREGEGSVTCVFSGYDARVDREDFRVLVRRD
jgi:hypothetical protein